MAARHVYFLEERARASGLAEPQQPGHLRLFNKNAGTTLHVPIVGQVENRAEWIVECETVPAYFQQILRPVEEG